MFWRFGFHTATAIESLLEKPDVSLHELLDEEEFLQECKSRNSKLIDFITANIQQLLEHIIQNSDQPEASKYAYYAAELFCCEVYQICDAFVKTEHILDTFWDSIKCAPSNHPRMQYFSKVNIVLFEKRPQEMFAFLKTRETPIADLLVHIKNSAITDLILKLISIEDLPEARGIIAWLNTQSLLSKLVDRLDPKAYDSEMHNVTAQFILDVIAVSYQNAAQYENMAQAALLESNTHANSIDGNELIDKFKTKDIMTRLVSYMLDKSYLGSSVITNGINIIIELIRRYCSEIEFAEYQQHHYQQQRETQSQVSLSGNAFGTPPPARDKLYVLATDLNELLRVLGGRLGEFADILVNPRGTNEPIETTVGLQYPLGSERLKTFELFAEILHLQYLYTSSPLFDRLVNVALPVLEMEGGLDDDGDDNSESIRTNRTNISDELVFITGRFVEYKVLPLCLDLFFKFPWNNFLHSVVYDMFAKVFNTYSFTLTVNFEDNPEGSPRSMSNNPAVVEEKMNAIRVNVRSLVVSIFNEGQLMEKIMRAQRDNDDKLNEARGVRLGFMGHLTYITDEVCKLVDKCSGELEELLPHFNDPAWEGYKAGSLSETKERDCQPLGGARPTMMTDAMPALGGIVDSDIGSLTAARYTTTSDNEIEFGLPAIDDSVNDDNVWNSTPNE